jgi:PTS system beta-glucosides-specific IIC component
MENTNTELGMNIIDSLGGSDNIKGINYCSTRLRLQLNDEKKLNLETVKKIPGVLGAVEAMGGVQVILGNNVNKVYAEIQKIYNFAQGAKVTGGAKFYDVLLNTVSAIVGPAIPLIMASGLVSAALVVCKMLGANPESHTYAVFNIVSNVVFYFLPIVLAYTSAIRFKCDPVTAIFFGGLMLHPQVLAMVEAAIPVRFLAIPMKLVNYSSTLVPIILTVWVLSYVEKISDKIVPEAIKYVFKPLFVIIIMTPVTLLLTGPLGAIIGDGIAWIVTSIYQNGNWLALLVIGAAAPFLVLMGMHLALLPLAISNFSTLGFDNLLFVAFIGMNFSQFAVSLAVLLKTKKPNLKQLATSCAITAFLSGITEPTLYGICIRLKKPLIATCIGCIANAVFCAITTVKTYAFGAPSFFTMPIFLNPERSDNNFMFACIAAGITIVVTFAATWILGFDDSIYDSQETAKKRAG